MYDIDDNVNDNNNFYKYLTNLNKTATLRSRSSTSQNKKMCFLCDCPTILCLKHNLVNCGFEAQVDGFF